MVRGEGSMAARENDATGDDTVASGTGAEGPEGTRPIPETDPIRPGGEEEPPRDILADESFVDPVVKAEETPEDETVWNVEPDEPLETDREAAASETAAQDVEPEPVVDPEPVVEPEPVIAPEPVAAPAAVGPHDHHAADDEHQEEEAEGSSFAAKLLTLLVVLIAGAALGIWAAPKVAPMLPSGMAPVAAWLTPGAAGAEDEIAALSGRIDDLSAKLDGVSGEVATQADVSSAVAAAKTETDAALADLRTTVEAADSADVAQRIARLESSVEGQAGEVSSLRDQLSGASASGSAEIDVYRAELEGLRGEMQDLTNRVAGLSHQIEEVGATADRSISAAEEKVAEIQQEAETQLNAAEIDADVALIRAALASGQPFTDAADRLTAAENVTLPEGLAAAAPSGAPTLQMLEERYPDAAHAAIRASIEASAGDGFLARSRAFVTAQLATRSLTPQDGEGTDAVLSRMEAKLKQNDLPGVLAEADALPSEAAAAMGPWLTDVRLRQGAEAGLGELQASLPATN